MTCHSHIFIVRKSSVSDSDTFIGPFIACYKLTIECGVHLYTAVSFYSVSHSLKHYVASVFQKPSQLNVIRVYHRAC